ARLVRFGQQEQVVSASLERDVMLQRLSDFEVTREQLRAQLADVDRRTNALDELMEATPVRQTTLVRTQDNGELVRELTSKLLTLELRRTELARKFAPTYPPLVELEQQIDQTRSALTTSQQAPIREEVTDQNPTHQWLRSERARVKAERDALIGRLQAGGSGIKEF